MSAQEDVYPVVCRFEGMTPDRLFGFESHRTRKGGDLGHVDRSRSGLNRRLIGPEDWAERALDEIERIRQENFAEEIKALAARKRKKDLEKRMAEGPRQPWRASRHGPLREVILTANKEFFANDLDAFMGMENQRIKDFENAAVEWLHTTFGADVIHARADLDEEAYHIHAVIMPRCTVEMTRTDKRTGEKRIIAKRKMLQPSKFDVIRDYELAQDSVGAHFASVGLVRGEKRKAAARAAYAKGEKPPPKRYHVRTRIWRMRQDARLASKAKRMEIDRQENDAVVSICNAVVDGSLDIEAMDNAEHETHGKTKLDELLARMTKSAGRYPKRAAAVLSSMRAAWRAMRAKAQEDAERDVRSKYERAAAHLGRVREGLASVSRELPADQRERLAVATAGFEKDSQDFEREVARLRVAEQRQAGARKKNDPR